MPTVALYVPAEVFRRLGSDAARVRVVAGEALELAAGVRPSPTRVLAADVSAPVLPTSVREFRPDPKKGK